MTAQASAFAAGTRIEAEWTPSKPSKWAAATVQAFDAEKQFGFFTNPGDGTLSARSLKSLDVVTTFKVGGTPTAIVALGKRETDD